MVHSGRMRWEMLFGDLESQLEAAASLDREAAASDLTRAEAATIVLTDRLRGLRGCPVRAALTSGRDVEGEIREVFPEWVLLLVAGRETILPLRAVESWAGLGGDAAPPTMREATSWLRAPRDGGPSAGRAGSDAAPAPADLNQRTPAAAPSGPEANGRRPTGSVLGLGQALRRLSRDRAVVVVQTLSREYHGRIDRVGRDHVDLQPSLGHEWRDRQRDQRIVIGFESVVLIGSSAR